MGTHHDYIEHCNHVCYSPAHLCPPPGIRASAAKPMAGMASTSFVRGKATLPDLPYDYGALEPHISGQIMELHHAKHHQTYVNGVNAAIEAIGDAQAKGDAQAAAKQAPLLNFHGGGHLNHSLFWENLAPTARAAVVSLP